MRAAIILALIVGITGCASLVLRPTDGAGTRAVKITTRVVLGLSTVGLSEIRVANVTNWRNFRDDLGQARTKRDVVGFLGLAYACQPVCEGLEA